MAVTFDRTRPQVIHPVHAFSLAGMLTLFLAALLADFAYSSSYQVQWLNFASWLIAGALVLGGFVLLFALIDVLRADRRGRRDVAYVVVVLAAWVLGFINALVHARDAWASMPSGLVLSLIVALLASVAAWMGLSSLRARSTP